MTNQDMANLFMEDISIKDRRANHGQRYIRVSMLLDRIHICFCDKYHHQRYAVLWEDMALRFYEGEARGNVLGKIKVLILYTLILTEYGHLYTFTIYSFR